MRFREIRCYHYNYKLSLIDSCIVFKMKKIELCYVKILGKNIESPEMN